MDPVDALRVQALPRDTADDGVTVAFNSAFDLRLVLDEAGTARLARRPDLEAIGISPTDAVTRALNNTISEVLIRLDVRSHELPGGATVRMAAADGVPYVSAGISSVSQLAGTDLPHGALIAVPRHSMLIIQPMLSRRDLSTVAIVDGFAGSMFNGAPDPCARQLFWFVDGDAYPLGTEPGPDGRPSLALSPPLAPVADRLPG